MTDAAGIERLAARLESTARQSVWAATAATAIAVADLLTGALTGDRRIDAGLVGVAGMCAWSAVTNRRLAARFRRGELTERTSARQVVRSGGSLLLMLAASAALGYLIGGRVLAIVVPLASAVVIGVAVLAGLRRRRFKKPA